MAQKRMFSLQIVDTDAFLDMSQSSQLLYFHLSMRADDEGFVSSPKKIMKMVSCAIGDYEELIEKKFIIPFESGVCVIKHWLIHNIIRMDRFNKTTYQKEKSQLILKDNNSYKLKQAIESEMATNWQPTGNQLVPQVKLSKVKLREERVQKPENEISFLEKIPEDVLTTLSEKYNASKEQITSKAEDLVDYCRSRNKRYSNYLAFLRTALKKDFGVMTEQQKIERKRKEETVKLMLSKRTPVISVDKTQERPETREEKQNRDSFEKLKRTLPVVKTLKR